MRIAIAAVIAVAVSVVPSVVHSAAPQDSIPSINRNSLLTGDYSFRVQGTDSQGNPVSIVGLMAFNGQGNITDGRFYKTLAGQTEHWGGASDFAFTRGDYSVKSHDTGRIHLQYMNTALQGCWEFVYDFALTKSGDGFYLSLSRFSFLELCEVSENLRYTLGGEATKQ
jgi:hypothetical protein